MSGNSSRAPLLVAVVGIAVALLVVLNIFQQRNDPKYQEQVAKEAARKQAEEAAKKQAEQQAPAADAGAAAELVAYGADKTLGNPSGATKVTIGWNWTPSVQADPSKVYAAVQAATASLPDASVRVVNLDALPGAVPAGVTVAGRTVIPPSPDGSIPVEAVRGALPAVAGGAGGGPPPGAVPPPPGPAPGAPAPAPATP